MTAVALRGQSSLVGAGVLVALICLAALAAAAAGAGPSRVLTVFFISLTAVLGIGIYSGNSGILSFGHLAFMGLGAYLSGILTMPVQMKQMTLPNLPAVLANAHLDLIPAALVTVLAVMAFAFVVGLVIARLEGSAATIATLALLIIVHGLIIGARDITRGSQSFFGVPRETDLWVATAAAALALLAAWAFKQSVPGLKLRASREDLIAAQAVGIDARRYRLLAWVVSAGLVALAGVLIGHFLGAFSAKKFYFVDTFALLAMLIVGGMATVSGALAGTVLITLVTEVLRRLEGGVEVLGVQLPEVFGTTQIGIGLIILLVMYRRAGGLLDRLEWNELLFKARPRTPPSEAAAAKTTRPDAALEGRGLSKNFDGLLAVDGVSISLAPGEIVGLIGPNGSGKTTLLNLLSGVSAPSAGRVMLDGSDLTGRPAYAFAAQGVGRTFQNVRLYRALSVRENILAAALFGWPRRSRADAQVIADAAAAAMGLGEDLDRQAATLSYGGQRRVEIARALALDPAFLFLDEPAAGMNREETDALMSDLERLRAERGVGILIVDHDLPLIIRLCDRIVVLNEGKEIAEGAPAEVQRDPAVAEAYLGRKYGQRLSEELKL